METTHDPQTQLNAIRAILDGKGVVFGCRIDLSRDVLVEVDGEGNCTDKGVFSPRFADHVLITGNEYVTPPSQ